MNRMNRIWVLNWRLELEENSNQTEIVHPELFRHKVDALRYAQRITRRMCRKFGHEADLDELRQQFISLGSAYHGRTVHVCCLTDSDNLVFELSQNSVRGDR